MLTVPMAKPRCKCMKRGKVLPDKEKPRCLRAGFPGFSYIKRISIFADARIGRDNAGFA
jgi:hypothetical protein